MKFNQRERILLLVTICAVIFYIWYQFLFSPKSEQIDKLRQELMAIRNRSTSVQAKIKAMNGLDNVNIQMVPKDVQLEKLVLHASRYPNLNILSITPTSMENTIKMEIVCRGDLDVFKSYLRSFSGLNLPLQIDAVSMDAGSSGLDIKLVLVSYF